MISELTNCARDADLDAVEASVQRLSAQVPGTPAAGVMLTRLILHLGRVMSTMLEQQIRPFGLTEPEFRVLTTLYSEPDGLANPTQLCRRTSQSPANMSRLSDALVGRGLITRVMSARDRRRMVLRITEPGAELVQRLLPQLFSPLRELFKDLSDTEQRKLIAQLKSVGLRLDEIKARHTSEQGG